MTRDKVDEILLWADWLIAQDRTTENNGRWGWHDDHRLHDGTPAYVPALQQVRAEFRSMVEALAAHGNLGGKMLQLGLGECHASHMIWSALFAERTLTIDLKICLMSIPDGGYVEMNGRDVHDLQAFILADDCGPYDFLLLDASHDYEGVMAEYEVYSPLVKPGGIIAFHDALKRDGYPELGVWRFLAENIPHDQINVIGTEVGFSWIIRK